MAERLRKKHSEQIRTKIQTTQLINVLQNHALGLTEEIKPSRMKAIEILLKKALPDLQSTEITGDADAPLGIKVVSSIDD
jgi:hypothetical protein